MPITTHTFLEALAKSNLLSPEQLTEARIEATAIGKDAAPKTVARGLIKQGFLTRWQAEQLLSGTTSLFLGRYKLLERIGKGGMGTVYKAEHTVMGRAVALKVMSHALLNDAGAVARFQREVQAAASLQHPNVVAAYDADCVGKTHFLVMEYVEGHDLKERLHQQGRLSVGWVCECIRQAALGLQHAHEHGMVHRDIKPANLLVTSERPGGPPLVKILDMGLARFVSDVVVDGGLTKSGQVMGTPDYIAPEQAEDTKHADIRADIFSLGCSLFHLLTGQTPYKGDTLMSKLMSRMQDTVPPASSLRSDVPQALDAVIAKMLQKNPDDRQQTPAEVAIALAPFAAHLDAAFDETISATAMAVQVSTVDVHDSNPEVDSGLNKFLGELANVPDHRKQRVGQRASKRRHSESDQKLVVSENAEANEPTDQEPGPKISSRVLMAAAACAAVVVLGGLAAFVLTRDATTVAEVKPVVQEFSEPESTLPDFIGEPVDTTSDADVASPAVEASPPKPAATAPPENTEPIEVEATMPEPPPADVPEKEIENTTPTEPSQNTPAISAKEPHKPQTLVVGVGTGELPDLKTAFEQAGPGDTILIRHRGPLEFDPVDLNGKTPLTILGDTHADGTDFWPIIRQITLNPGDKTQPTKSTGLFHGDQLELTLRKLHLVVAGPKRAAIDAVFAMGQGRVELDECTVTVGVEREPGSAAGKPMPLVHSNPTTGGRLELVLNRTFLRGQRLQACVRATGTNQIDIKATQIVWAGGPAPWLQNELAQSSFNVTLANCTIYNASSFLLWGSDQLAFDSVSRVEVQAEKCLFVGPYANKEPFVAWRSNDAERDLSAATAAGVMRWNGDGNIFERYDEFFQRLGSRGQQKLDGWRSLWEQTGTSMAREADPMFRVWPNGYVLQESEARDFQPRFLRNKRLAQQLSSVEIGADYKQLPIATANIVGQPASPSAVATVPRGQPRILSVHQKDGPYRTIEDAWADVRDEDIIEILDDGPYRPKRNFSTHPARSVLFSPTLTACVIRAADDANPVVILDESVQQGALPAPTPRERSVLLLNLTKGRTLQLEGLHFRFNTAAETRRAVVFGTDVAFLRCSNCTFFDASPGRGEQTNGGGTDFFAHGMAGRVPCSFWLENNFYWGVRQESCSLDVKSASFAFVHVKNCVCVGGFLRRWDGPSNLELESNTFLGPAFSVFQNATLSFVTCDENIVLVPPGISMTNVVPMPVPPMNVAPSFEGIGTSKDPYRQYRLRKGQPAATAAADGGPIGVRIEYLPDMPASR